jgi:hypothetical protein
MRTHNGTWYTIKPKIKHNIQFTLMSTNLIKLTTRNLKNNNVKKSLNNWKKPIFNPSNINSRFNIIRKEKKSSPLFDISSMFQCKFWLKNNTWDSPKKHEASKITHKQMFLLATLLHTSGCLWPKATVKPLCEIQVPKLRSHILKITS